MFQNGQVLIQPLQETIHSLAPGARLNRLTAPPVIGGVLLAMEMAGNKLDNLGREILTTTISRVQI
jgi:hypothetical protein